MSNNKAGKRRALNRFGKEVFARLDDAVQDNKRGGQRATLSPPRHEADDNPLGPQNKQHFARRGYESQDIRFWHGQNLWWK